MYKGTFYIYHVSNFRYFGVASTRGRMMEELISRQTIIDGLEFVIRHGIETDRAHSISAEAMLEFVRELPTVQPEITHEQAIDYLHSTGWMQEHDRQMMLDGVHRVIAQPEPHWIPVAEQPPEVGKSVLICDAYGDICLGHRTQWGYYYPDFCEDKVKDVRAWCELPEPYKGVTT